jgi:aminobenzoyl-glutamate utilization protein B
LWDKFESFRDQPIIGDNFPPMDEGIIGTGSTDVGDLSWVTPVSLLRTACWPTGALAHGWAVVAACGTTIGYKGMLHAAKIMALTAMDLFLEPDYIQKANRELQAHLKGGKYQCPLPEHVQPPRVLETEID